MIRKIDELGRICIPKEIRRETGLNEEVEITTDGSKIILSNPKKKDLKEFIEKKLKETLEEEDMKTYRIYSEILEIMEE